MQLVVDTGSFTGGGLGPPNLFKICQPWLLEREKKCFEKGKSWGKHPTRSKGGTKRMFWWGEVLRETLMRESLEGKIPPNPGNKCESSEESDNRPSLFNSPKNGIFDWYDGFFNWIVCFSYFYYVYIHISNQTTHLARTPRVKRPNRGPPTTPNMVKEAYTRLVKKTINKRGM